MKQTYSVRLTAEEEDFLMENNISFSKIVHDKLQELMINKKKTIYESKYNEWDCWALGFSS